MRIFRSPIPEPSVHVTTSITDSPHAAELAITAFSDDVDYRATYLQLLDEASRLRNATGPLSTAQKIAA